MPEIFINLDPGFVNHRKVMSVLPEQGVNVLNRRISELPINLMDWEKPMQHNRCYCSVLTEFCRGLGVLTLTQALESNCQPGCLVASIEDFLPNESIYEDGETNSMITPINDFDKRIIVRYSTNNIISETLRSELKNGYAFGIIAMIDSINETEVILRPLIIGFPHTYDSKGNLSWGQYYENFRLRIDDIDEFSKVKEVELPSDSSEMLSIYESVYKDCLSQILGAETEHDWGGESSDIYTNHLTYKGKKFSGAFLLKGRSVQGIMKMKNLGKNANQILHLCETPAEILFVQHCNDIGEDVVKHLQTTAVTPLKQRYFCIIDGRDSLRILIAYNLLDYALSQSDSLKSQKSTQS